MLQRSRSCSVRVGLVFSLLPLAAVGCSGERPLSDTTATRATVTQSHANPAFLRKLADPAGYHVQRRLAALESICGQNDLQAINSYDGTLGQPVEFVRQHKFAVGAMESTNTDGSDKFCTGTLVGPDLFITANHCIDADTTKDYVSLNFEKAEGVQTLLQQEHFRIHEVVEQGTSLDYAVVRLEGMPGLKFGWATLRTDAPATGDLITIVQHPNGEAKMVEIGHISGTDGDYMQYGDLDTEPGSSGSGILDAHGHLIGIHTNGGCDATSGSNSGVRLAVARDSTVLSRLSNANLPFQDGSQVSLAISVDGVTRQLAGASDGSVSLLDNGAEARVIWTVEDLRDGAFRLALRPGTNGPQYLDGRVADHGVRLSAAAAAGDFGARWRVTKTDDGQFVLRTVGNGEGPRWLSAAAAAVALSDGATAWTLSIR